MLRPPLHLLAVVAGPPVGVDAPGGDVKRQQHRLTADPLRRLRGQMHLRIEMPSLFLRGKKTGHKTGIAPPAAAKVMGAPIKNINATAVYTTNLFITQSSLKWKYPLILESHCSL